MTGIMSSATLQQPPTILVPSSTHSGMRLTRSVCSSGWAQVPHCQVSPVLGYTTNGTRPPAAFRASRRAPLISLGEEQLNPMARSRLSLEMVL